MILTTLSDSGVALATTEFELSNNFSFLIFNLYSNEVQQWRNPSECAIFTHDRI